MREEVSQSFEGAALLYLKEGAWSKACRLPLEN